MDSCAHQVGFFEDARGGACGVVLVPRRSKETSRPNNNKQARPSFYNYLASVILPRRLRGAQPVATSAPY